MKEKEELNTQEALSKRESQTHFNKTKDNNLQKEKYNIFEIMPFTLYTRRRLD